MSMPAPTMDSQRVLVCNALSHVDVRVSELIFSSHEAGGGGEKRSRKTFAKGAQRIFAVPFLVCSRATCCDLKVLLVSPARLYKRLYGIGEVPDKGFSE